MIPQWLKDRWIAGLVIVGVVLIYMAFKALVGD